MEWFAQIHFISNFNIIVESQLHGLEHSLRYGTRATGKRRRHVPFPRPDKRRQFVTHPSATSWDTCGVVFAQDILLAALSSALVYVALF